MKKILLIITVIFSGITIIAMQQPATQKYMQVGFGLPQNEKLMKIIMGRDRYNIHHDEYLSDVKNALSEGADPNYVHTHIFRVNPYSPSQTVQTTPLYEAIKLRDHDLINILRQAGANLNLKNIVRRGQADASAYEVAQEYGIDLHKIRKQP